MERALAFGADGAHPELQFRNQPPRTGSTEFRRIDFPRRLPAIDIAEFVTRHVTAQAGDDEPFGAAVERPGRTGGQSEALIMDGVRPYPINSLNYSNDNRESSKINDLELF